MKRSNSNSSSSSNISVDIAWGQDPELSEIIKKEVEETVKLPNSEISSVLKSLFDRTFRDFVCNMKDLPCTSNGNEDLSEFQEEISEIKTCLEHFLFKNSAHGNTTSTKFASSEHSNNKSQRTK